MCVKFLKKSLSVNLDCKCSTYWAMSVMNFSKDSKNFLDGFLTF